MTIEDLNKAAEYNQYKEDIRYAWYTNDATDEELKDVTAGGKVYKAKRHGVPVATGVTKPRFYTWDDENGVTHTAKNENDYNDNISNTTPILTSRTWYSHNPGVSNAVINEILGGDDTRRGWLASSCVNVLSDYEYAYFVMCSTYSGYAGGYSLYRSTAYVNAPTYGLRPTILFNINQLDILDTTKDGSESAAWNIE